MRDWWPCYLFPIMEINVQKNAEWAIKKKNNPEKLHGNIGYTRRRKTKQKYSTVIEYVLDTTIRKQTQIT